MPDHEHEQPHQREPQAGIAQRRPPGAAREPDRNSVQDEHRHEEPRAEDADALDAGLRGRELVRAHQRDRPRLVRQLGEGILRDPELGTDLDDELVQVERDVAAARGDAVPGLVLEHVDELLVGDRAHANEELLDPRPRERTGHGSCRRLLERAGEGRRQRPEGRREPIRERLRDVDVLVQLVDRVRRDRRLHRRVLDDLGRRLVPGRVVEHLPVDPVRQDRDEGDDRGEDDEGPDEDAALTAQRRGSCHGGSVPPG